jgi:hypothetical protein
MLKIWTTYEIFAQLNNILHFIVDKYIVNIVNINNIVNTVNTVNIVTIVNNVNTLNIVNIVNTVNIKILLLKSNQCTSLAASTLNKIKIKSQ